MTNEPAATFWLGVGSNLGNREHNLRRAAELLGEVSDVDVCGGSRFYDTKAVGPEQPRFLNGVLGVRTRRSPREILHAVLEIEQRLGRVRTREERWGPRTIDIDLLLAGTCVVQDTDLTLPHPRLHERHFVLVPLVECAPMLIHPTLGRTVSDLLEELGPVPENMRCASEGFQAAYDMNVLPAQAETEDTH